MAGRHAETAPLIFAVMKIASVGKGGYDGS
jgi:hypothetical protein